MENIEEVLTPYYTGYINDDPTLFIPLAITNPHNEKKTVHCNAVVDTGFNGTLLITPDLKDRLNLHPATFPFKHVERYSEMVDSGNLFTKRGTLQISIPMMKEDKPGHLYNYQRDLKGFYVRKPEESVAEDGYRGVLIGLPFIQHFGLGFLLHDTKIEYVRANKSMFRLFQKNEVMQPYGYEDLPREYLSKLNIQC